MKKNISLLFLVAVLVVMVIKWGLPPYGMNGSIWENDKRSNPDTTNTMNVRDVEKVDFTAPGAPIIAMEQFGGGDRHYEPDMWQESRSRVIMMNNPIPSFLAIILPTSCNEIIIADGDDGKIEKRVKQSYFGTDFRYIDDVSSKKPHMRTYWCKGRNGIEGEHLDVVFKPRPTPAFGATCQQREIKVGDVFSCRPFFMSGGPTSVKGAVCKVKWDDDSEQVFQNCGDEFVFHAYSESGEYVVSIARLNSVGKEKEIINIPITVKK